MCVSPRDHLPSRRRCITQKIKVGGQSVHYTIGLYEDGRPGEVFIDVSKAGAALRQWAGDTARMMSIALQHGTPLETALNLFIGARCEPSGRVEGHPLITEGLSIMDVIARDIAITFLGRNDLANIQSDIPLIVETARNGSKWETVECKGSCKPHRTQEPEVRNTSDSEDNGENGGVDTNSPPPLQEEREQSLLSQ